MYKFDNIEIVIISDSLNEPTFIIRDINHIHDQVSIKAINLEIIISALNPIIKNLKGKLK